MRGFLTSLTRAGAVRTGLALFGLSLPAVVGLPTLGATALSGQEATLPEVVSKMVAFGPEEARLTLELSDGRTVELSLADGAVRMGDARLGSYPEGGALEDSWRDLVARSVGLEGEALLQALVDWDPPQGLSNEGAEVAARMDEFLTLNFDSASVEALALEAAREAERVSDALGEGLRGLEGLAILSRLDVLAEFAEAVNEMDTDNLRVVIDDHLEIGAGTDYPGSVLVIDGSLEVRGSIRGDVMVVDGDVELRPGSEVRGTIRLSDASLDNDGGRIRGDVIDLDNLQLDFESDLRAEILREISDEIGMDLEARRENLDWGAPFRRVFGGIGDIFGRLFNVLIIGLIGTALFSFAGTNMDAVAETARNSTGRAALVGMAGAALALPIFVLGIIGLAVTIIGIPAIILWVPLFPAALLAAALAGYLAVARNVGAWLSRQDYPFTDWVRVTNPATLVFGGLLVLAGPFFVADVLDTVGFLDVFAVLVGMTGFIMSAFAGAVGLGAVLLTRGGRKPEDWDKDLFTRSWRERRWGRKPRDWEAERFDEEMAGATSTTSADGGTGHDEAADSAQTDDAEKPKAEGEAKWSSWESSDEHDDEPEHGEGHPRPGEEG